MATRATPREVNRQIVLNLIREHQPISRAELARRMNVRRAALTEIVRDLLDAGEIIETGRAVAARGRRPTLLRIQTSTRLATAVDVRPAQTTVVLADFGGSILARDVFATPSQPADLVAELGTRVVALLAGAHDLGKACQGIGVVVPGMVDRRGGRVLYAPRLGWRDVDLRDSLARQVDMPVFVESAPIACALARLWTVSGESRAVNNFAYVSVSDGVGVGIVVHGEVLRGEAHTAGEFGHVSLDPFGPQCACGKRGCWEAFACNAATSRRYVENVGGSQTGKRNGGRHSPLLPVEEIVRRAKRGEHAAEAAIEATGREIGRGLAAVVSAINPKRIYLGGEITAAWELIEKPMRDALVEGTLTAAARETPIIPDRQPGEYRVLGAIALVAAPNYAAPRVG
ncbi:MAG TPA: ROK family protein [Gemmatimonadaceae bacterium]|nr:ROK family protein [Gemmatimonadaceae bacterium]